MTQRTQYAERMNWIETSASAAMSQRAREMKADGADVIALSSGQPDFPTPDHVIEAANAAAKRGETKYTTISGSVELKDAVIEKFQRENGLSFGRDQIIVGNGAKQVLFNAIMAWTDAGDEVILPAPYYIAYLDMIKFAQGKAVIVKCGADQDFRLTPKQLADAITPKTAPARTPTTTHSRGIQEIVNR